MTRHVRLPLLLLCSSLFGARHVRADRHLEELIDGVVARSAAIYQAQFEFEMEDKLGPSLETQQLERSSHYQLTVAGNEWILRHGGSPNLMMNREDASVRYYEAKDAQGNRQQSLHITAPLSLEAARGQNLLYTVPRHGTFWYPTQAAFVHQHRDAAQLVEQYESAGAQVAVLQWQISAEDFGEALLVIPPEIAKRRQGLLRVHVAPDLGSALPRIEYCSPDGNVAKRFECSDFVEIEEDLFFPHHTKCITWVADQVAVSEFRLRDIRFVNRSIPDETFAFPVPAQTRVRDARPGFPRTVFQLKTALPFEELETTLAPPRADSSWRPLCAVCLLINLLAVFTLLLVWLRKRSGCCLSGCLVGLAAVLLLDASAGAQAEAIDDGTARRSIRSAEAESWPFRAVYARRAGSGAAHRFTLSEVLTCVNQHREFVRMCGPLSAVRALSSLGHRVDIEQTLQRYRNEKATGVRLQQVLELCREFDPRARAIRMTDQKLHRLTTPCILLVNDGRHCIVLESLRRQLGVATIWDPSDLQSKTISVQRLRAMWSGQAILFEYHGWSSSAMALITAGSTTLALFAVMRIRSCSQQDRSAVTSPQVSAQFAPTHREIERTEAGDLREMEGHELPSPRKSRS